MTVSAQQNSASGSISDSVAGQPCARSTDVLSAEQAEQIATVMKALSDPVRVQLYSRISCCDEICVCDLGDLGVSQPTVSHHLKKLRDAGLIECERRGTWVYYRAVPDALTLLDQLHS